MMIEQFSNTNLIALSDEESREVNGGCVGWFCMGQVLEAWNTITDIASRFANGVAEGFEEGMSSGNRNVR